MNVKMGVSVMLGLLGVVLAILALSETMGAEWTAVSQGVAPVIVMIAFIGFVIVVIAKR